MAIPTENSVSQSTHDIVKQRYKKAIELEKRLRNSIQTKTPSDPNIWNQMRENYEAIILEDHDFAESNDIPHLLWQLHYKRIEEFRARMRNAIGAANGNNSTQGGKNVMRREQVNKIRCLFKSFLSEATGFYHELILKIKAKYGFPVHIFSQQTEDYLASPKDKSKSVDLMKAQIACHRCLIYLGDLARYKEIYGEGETPGRDFSVASSYYMQASSLWPASGNPHHQLAILASYINDELVAVYRYFRSLAVETPFSTARDNLILIFEKNRLHYSQIHEAEATLVKQTPAKSAGRGRGKGDRRFALKEDRQDMTAIKRRQVDIQEVNRTFRVRFVRLNGILFTRTSLETFDEVYSTAINEFEELITPGPTSEMGIGSDTWANGSTFSGLVVLHLVTILIFTVHNVNMEAENGSLSYAEILQRSVLLQNAFTASFGFAGCIINRSLNMEDVSSSPLLPAILVFMEWLACRRDVAMANESVEEKQANARSFFWKSSVGFLNRLLDLESIHRDFNGGRLEGDTTFTSLSRYNEDEAGGVGLWEDFELRGFIPLAPAQLALDFSKRQFYNNVNGKKERDIRMQRILAAGKAVANLLQGSGQGIFFDIYMMKFRDAREVPEVKIRDEFEHIKPKVSNSINNLDNHVKDVVGSDTVSQGKPALCASGVSLVKLDSDIEEEEDDEVIVFKPTVADRNSESRSLQQSPLTNVANMSLQNSSSAFASVEPPHKFSNVSSVMEPPMQISGCSSSLASGMNDSSPYSNPQEVAKLFASSTSSLDHLSTGLGISASDISNQWSTGSGLSSCISNPHDTWGIQGYGSPFVGNHASLPGIAAFGQQPIQLTNQPNPLWYRDPETNVLNGMMNLNLGHQIAGNGSMFKSELPVGTMGRSDSVSTNLLSNSIKIPSQGLYSSNPHVSLSTTVASMPGRTVDPTATKSVLQSQSQTDTSTPLITSIAAKPTNTQMLGSKKGVGAISRPVRHLGPPPGFGPVPSRILDSAKADVAQRTSAASYMSEQIMQRDEQPRQDDYRWLDDYTPLNKDGGRKDSLVPQSSFSLSSVSENLVNAANFPFPGKQVLNMQMLQEQKLQLNRRNQEQPLWSGKFFGQDP